MMKNPKNLLERNPYNLLRKPRRGKAAKAKPDSWDDFFQQPPCPDFPTVEELRGSLGEDTPRKSPFDVGGIKTKATTQDILDAVKDSRSRKGKE